MASMTANRAPQPILTAGQRFTLRAAAVIGALFLIAFSYGHAERSMITDVVTVVVAVWHLVTNPWLYAAVVGVAIVWKNRKVINQVLNQPPRRTVRYQMPRRVEDPNIGRHRAARHG